jgi:nucleoside-diphosphate-sugar epimerase
MTILVLGGKGQTSQPLASILQQNHIPFIVGSRSPTDDGFSRHIRFDWLDESTYDTAFDYSPDGIEAVYMVPPEVSDCFTPMKRFIDHIRKRGTRRFVLLSSSAIAKGGPFFGAVHDYLSAIDVEYEVLRPTWFQGMLNTYFVPLAAR